MYGMEWKHAQPFKVLSGGCGGKNAIEGIGPLAISGEVRNRLVAGSQHEAWSYPNLQDHRFQTYHEESPIAGPFSQ